MCAENKSSRREWILTSFVAPAIVAVSTTYLTLEYQRRQAERHSISIESETLSKLSMHREEIIYRRIDTTLVLDADEMEVTIAGITLYNTGDFTEEEVRIHAYFVTVGDLRTLSQSMLTPIIMASNLIEPKTTFDSSVVSRNRGQYVVHIPRLKPGEWIQIQVVLLYAGSVTGYAIADSLEIPAINHPLAI